MGEDHPHRLRLGIVEGDLARRLERHALDAEERERALEPVGDDGELPIRREPHRRGPRSGVQGLHHSPGARGEIHHREPVIGGGVVGGVGIGPGRGGDEGEAGVMADGDRHRRADVAEGDVDRPGHAGDVVAEVDIGKGVGRGVLQSDRFALDDGGVVVVGGEGEVRAGRGGAGGERGGEEEKEKGAAHGGVSFLVGVLPGRVRGGVRGKRRPQASAARRRSAMRPSASFAAGIALPMVRKPWIMPGTRWVATGTPAAARRAA